MAILSSYLMNLNALSFEYPDMDVTHDSKTSLKQILLESSPNLVLKIHHMPSSEMLELLLVTQVLFSNNECSKKKRIGQCPHVYALEEDNEDKFL